MKNTYSLLIISLLLLAVKLQAQTELDNYLEIGAENNPLLKEKLAQYNAALEKIPQVGSLPDPVVSIGYFISPVETRIGPQQAKVSINQSFPWFGTRDAKEAVKIQFAKSKYEAYEEAKSNLYFNLKSAYNNVYFFQKGIDITIENIRILNTFQQLAIIKIETGKASVVDEMRVEMEINELNNQLDYLNDSKFAMELKFKKLLNYSSDISIIIPDTLWIDTIKDSKEMLVARIITENHNIKQLEYNMLSWQSQQQVAKKMGQPKISLGIDYTVIGNSTNAALGNENGKDAILLPKVGISIPIYRKKYTAMVNEAALNLKASEYKKEGKKNELLTILEKGYTNYTDASRRITLYQKQLKLAEKSLSILLTSYTADGQNFEEVLRMERKQLNFALELDKARTDNNAAVAFIEFLLGQ